MQRDTESAENLRSESYAYPSRRMPVIASRGVVATSEPLAAQAGLEMLQRGGNAVDAAIATAITLTVVEPTSNGIGADAFALVWDGKKLHGLNASGRAPATHTPELFEKLGHTEYPRTGWLPVTVPGAPAAWRDLHDKFGKLPFAQLFAPAIRYASGGYPLAPVVAEGWGMAARRYAETNHGPEFAPWFATFTKDGTPPRAGDVWELPDHARTLQRIAESGAEDFYKGELAGQIADFAAETNGYITRADLAAHTSTWVDPISVSYRGHEVWEIPPNGQGIATLAALNVLEGFDLGAIPRETTESYHLQIEAMKLGFSDAHRYVADMERADVPMAGMLDKEYASQRRRLITDRAMQPEAGEPPRGGTVYLCAADGDGMMISMIQSNYQGFGSGIVVRGTGIALQNRGAGFRLERNHLNCVAPGKRPYHTIIPAFLTRGGEALGPFGVMGGFMQPQGHLQMVVNQVDYGMNPQTSLDAPRWQWMKERTIAVEMSAPQHVLSGLGLRGHKLEVHYAGGGFGKGQIIRRLKNGVYVAGSEPRADGCAVGI
ncbi:MAG: gamma-glutamyltransferase family protein [Thermomicrobiales bacterium]